MKNDSIIIGTYQVPKITQTNNTVKRDGTYQIPNIKR